MLIRNNGIKLLLIFVVLLGLVKVSMALPVAIGERVYLYLEKAAAMGYIETPLLWDMPWDCEEVAQTLINLENRRRAGEIELPATLVREHAYQLLRYRREIDSIVAGDWWEECPGYSPRIAKAVNRQHIIDFGEPFWGVDGTVLSVDYDNGSWFSFDPAYHFRYDGTSSDRNVLRRAWGVDVAGSPYPGFEAFVQWFDVAEWDNEQYPSWDGRYRIFDDRIGYVSTKSEDRIEHEELRAGITLRRKGLNFFFGRDRVRWGPGRHGNLMLSGEATTIPHGRLRFDIGMDIRYTMLAGQLGVLNSFSDSVYTAPTNRVRRLLPEKFITAHRLSFSPLDNLQIGLQEVVVYAEHGLKFHYLNPVTVLFTEEHEAGDQDNAMMGGDIWVRLKPGWTAWGELLLDDFQFGKIGTDYYGNKLAWISGTEYNVPLAGSLLESGIEYARLRPFVYTHFFPINTYQHWTAPLGLQLQPNSDRTTGWVSMWTNPYLRFGLEGNLLRHGDNVTLADSSLLNTGGDIEKGHVIGENEAAPFLDGNRDDIMQFHGWVEYEILEDFYLAVMVGYENYVDRDQQGMRIAAGVAWNRPLDRRWSLRGR
ncbi:capsule assembly Wzi family protein [bacterium]|nr:capsule assembly Wzi family protein [bacterium]